MPAAGAPIRASRCFHADRVATEDPEAAEAAAVAAGAACASGRPALSRRPVEAMERGSRAAADSADGAADPTSEVPCRSVGPAPEAEEPEAEEAGLEERWFRGRLELL